METGKNPEDTPCPKTFQEHRDYLYEIVKLKLCFLWLWLKSHPEETFEQALRGRVDIYRKTDINPGYANHKTRDFNDQRWRDLENQASKLYHLHRGDESPARFEAAAFELIQPLIDARAPRDFNEPPEAFAFKFRFGSLDYDPPAPQKRGRIFLHIANALTPRSFFDDPEHLKTGFKLLINAARKDGAGEIETETWLNSYKRWTAWFPETWQENMSPPRENVDPGFGWWGQFLSARGTFNHKNGLHMRATGDFPFHPRHSWCTLDELETFIFHERHIV